MSSSASSVTEHPIHVVVEIPKGSRNKYELDHQTGRIRLDRMLFSPVHYPTDYGFVPDTLAEDGDPLDALVLLGEPTFPGCEIQVRIVGMLDMADDKGPDQKLLVVPLTDPHWNHIHQIDQVPPGEIPVAAIPRFVLETDQQMDGVVPNLVGRNFRLEIKCAEAALATSGSVKFRVQVKDAIRRDLYEAKIRITGALDPVFGGMRKVATKSRNAIE